MAYSEYVYELYRGFATTGQIKSECNHEYIDDWNNLIHFCPEILYRLGTSVKLFLSRVNNGALHSTKVPSL